MFSKAELSIMRQIALGTTKIPKIAAALKKHKSQVYRTTKSLSKKGYVSLKKGEATPSEKTHVQILLQELSKQPSFIPAIKGKGLKIFLAIHKNAKPASEIIRETSIKKSTVFYKLSEAKKYNLLSFQGNKYIFNKAMWPGLHKFLSELYEHENHYDKRIPPGATIYHKDSKEIVFSTKKEVDATLTGFNAYENYGIKILCIDYMYCLPKRNLTKKDILMHSIYRVEKEKSIQDMILTALFYAKHKKEFQGIQHEFLDNINKILEKQRIKKYPIYEEIKDRAEVYGIKI